jgi:hypothetical protein
MLIVGACACNPSNDEAECGRKARRGREIHECYSKTKENWSWGMLSGDQGRVTSLQKLKQPMK